MCYKSVPALGIEPAHTCQVEESQVAVECAALRRDGGQFSLGLISERAFGQLLFPARWYTCVHMYT